MKLTKYEGLRAGGEIGLCSITMLLMLLWMAPGQMAQGQGVSTTTVQGTVYLANGQPGAGTLVVSWPAFTTAAAQAVAADSTTVTIAPDGFVSVSLAPNVGATPAGEYYTAIFYMSDGTVSTQYWVVPAAAQASLAQVQSQVMPAAQAVQAVSKAYVDQAVAEAAESQLTASGGNLTGPLYLNADPTQALQAADKHYVDTEVATAVPLAGGNMTGALTSPTVNGVQAPSAVSGQTTLQAAMNAAGTNGAMEIPPAYAGTDGFTNPNGVRVTDLRSNGAQQVERSVKEFGAVCDGVTDDTNALQTALNYANTHGVALTIPEGTCKTRTLNWHGESIGGLGKQVSALMGFPGQDVLASTPDATNMLSYTRLHDLTIYVDQSVDESCSAAAGRTPAGSCQVSRPMESNSIFSPGGNGLTGTAGTGAGWSVGNCAIAMPAATGAGGNGLRVAEIENLEIAATGTDPMAAEYPGAHSTHTCGLYLGQWPQWSEFRNIDIRGLNTGIAIPALPGTTPANLNADSNRWQNITIQATHGFTAAAGSNNVLDNVVTMAGNSAATGEPPTGLVLDFAGNGQNTAQGWTVRNAVTMPAWDAVQPALTVTAAGGAVTAVTVGSEHGLGWDPYGVTVPVKFSGSCTAQATAAVNADGSIGTVSVTQGGAGCSTTTTASVNAAGTWDTAAPVNLIGGQDMTFFAGNLLKGNGGYTVWKATGSESYGTQLDGGGGTLPGGGSYAALVENSRPGTTLQVDQFPGADFGAQLQACLSAVSPQFGGDCDARNFSGTLSMGSNLTISTGNTTVQLPCATIATANQIVVTAGTRNVALRGCALRGGSAASGNQGGTVFEYSGTGAMVQVGDPTYAVDTPGFHLDDAVINTTGATSAAAQGLAAYRTQELDLESLYFLGNANQTGMTLDGTGNYTGGTFYDNQFSGYQTAVNAIGHQIANPATTDWMNASTFVRVHIDCPTSGGNPTAGTYGINLQQGDGNTFTGGDVEGCWTALHLGANAQNNTIVGLRNENSTYQVVADAGSSYNNWMTGGTMFTGKLTDNGTRNSFLDTFHRSFNGLNGDWYGSQQDATVTNHYRLGIGAGNERGLLNEIQTDSGYRWLEGYSDATSGEQLYQVEDLLNNVNRLSIGQYNPGQSSTNNQTVINAAGTGAVVLNGSNNAGTGGVVIGSGGAGEATVATISNAGNAQFNGTLQVGGTAQTAGTMTVRNNADAEVDYYLWPGLTASQKGSFTYKDWNGNSQWYMVKDASNNWALNSAVGGLDSFKAYQSTNSGDTYVNASNATGHIRLNYESGSGAETDIYSGSSANLDAAFLGPASIKFPGLAASSGHNCLHIDTSGYVTNTGSDCGTGSGGSGGTISSANSGQIAYYTGNGTSIGGMSTIPLTAGGTGAGTAAGAVSNLLPGISSDGANGIGVTGAVTAKTATASVNRVLLVTAPPYNAKCDGVTDDQAAIQSALNDAKTDGYTVQFPAGTCKTSTVTYYGQSFFGAGVGQTYIVGQPGEDVFQTPDSAVTLLQKAYIHDLTIEVDSSVNAASSAVGGNNTFPNRITGTDGGTTPLSTPPAPGPRIFASGGSINSGSTTFTLPGALFNAIPSALVVGAPVTIDGAGASGTNLTTTISTVVSSTQVTIATVASTTVTNAAGQWGTGIQPPWYMGNCGFALQGSNGAALPTGANSWNFRNLYIEGVDYGVAPFGTNYTCGMFLQGNPYAFQYDNVTVHTLWGGIIEAPPAANNTSYFAWTPDTSTYKNFVSSITMIPMTWYDGSHRSAQGINIYGGNQPMSLGLFQFGAPLGTSPAPPSATISQYYFEPYGGNSGEESRFSGTDVINGGSLYQSGDCSDVNFITQSSFVDAQINATGSCGGLEINGNQNTFQHTQLSSSQVTDNGFDNSVEAGVNTSDANSQRRYYPDSIPPQSPVGMLDGGFLLSGNSQTPYVSGSDLFTTCRDYRFATGGSSSITCVPDPADVANIAKSYIHTSSNTGISSPTAGYWFLFPFGARAPLTKTYMIAKGRCDGGATSCSTIVKYYDATTSTSLGLCSWTFGANWTTQGAPGTASVCLVDYSAANAGDVWRFGENTWSSGGGTLSGVDRAWIAFEPVNSDTQAEIAGASITYTGNNTYSGVLANGMTATTQTAGDASAKVATDAFVQAAVVGGGFNNQVPAWLQYMGDGSDGAETCTSGTCYVNGENWFSSLNISSGAILATQSSVGQSPTVLRVTGACTIAGTFSLSYNSGGTTNQTTNANWGATGGGGGGGTAAGGVGHYNTSFSAGGTAGAASGGAGGNGSSPTASYQKEIVAQSAPLGINNFNNTIYYYGGAAGGAGGSSGSAGGNGGGGLILICGSISFTGAIDVSGQPGGNATANNTGAGGGGGGGFVIMRSPNWIANTGTINVSGGSGGSCGAYTGCGAGGAGGSGWYKEFTN